MNTLGNRIRQLRENHKLNQIELAEKINISNCTLCQYESGYRIPSDDIKIKIATFFNVSVDYLLGIEENKIDLSKEEEKLLFQYRTNPKFKQIIDLLLEESE